MGAGQIAVDVRVDEHGTAVSALPVKSFAYIGLGDLEPARLAALASTYRPAQHACRALAGTVRVSIQAAPGISAAYAPVSVSGHGIVTRPAAPVRYYAQLFPPAGSDRAQALIDAGHAVVRRLIALGVAPTAITPPPEKTAAYLPTLVSYTVPSSVDPATVMTALIGMPGVYQIFGRGSGPSIAHDDGYDELFRAALANAMAGARALAGARLDKLRIDFVTLASRGIYGSPTADPRFVRNDVDIQVTFTAAPPLPAPPPSRPSAPLVPPPCAHPNVMAGVVRAAIPAYPDAAIAQRIEGTVEIRISLDAQSHLTNASIYSSPSALLNDAALLGARVNVPNGDRELPPARRRLSARGGVLAAA